MLVEKVVKTITGRQVADSLETGLLIKAMRCRHQFAGVQPHGHRKVVSGALQADADQGLTDS